MKRKNALALCLIFTVLASACGTENPPVTTGDSSSASDSDTEVTQKFVYEYPELGEGEFNILSSESVWEIYMDLDFPEMTGETLDDAVFARNRFVEEKTGLKINVENYKTGGDFGKLTNHAANLILSGDDTYEVMYIKPAAKVDLITDGALVDLRSLPALNLEADWWDHIITDSAAIDGKLYFASGAFGLMPFETSWCVYFNETLFEKYSLEFPYDLVRNGEWTIEKLMTIAKSADLRGNESFAYKNGGEAVYGLSTHTLAVNCLLFGAGVRTVSKSGGEFSYSLSGNRFHKVAELIGNFASRDGEYFRASATDWDAEKGGYIYTFANDRAFLLTGQIKTSGQLRSMKSEFGILPFPKLDADQEEYYTYITGNNLMMTIPVTNKDPGTTAAMIDALTYRSYETVLPVYYENRVAQKGLRNEDSIEMLDIIRSGRGIDVSDYFLWNSGVSDKVKTSILSGDGTVASIAESERIKTEEAIKSFMEKLK